ncbi:putative short-chain dehydrogenase [Biscogniauxia marginata]|nr:putative short-chain dehydrogenase [Biscogniauxia marginata]
MNQQPLTSLTLTFPKSDKPTYSLFLKGNLTVKSWPSLKEDIPNTGLPRSASGNDAEISPKGTILLTGANGGLGLAVVRKIVSRPELATYHGLYAVRDSLSSQRLRSALRDATLGPHPHDIVSLDLTRLDTVRDVATTINARVAADEIPPIRVLILNAAYLEFKEQTWTAEGFDTSFAATYPGHWLLTLMLLQSIDRNYGRILVIGSSAHKWYCLVHKTRVTMRAHYAKKKWQTIFHDSTEPIAKGTWSSTREDPSFRGGYRRYGAAQLCQVMMMYAFLCLSPPPNPMMQNPVLKGISVLGIDPGSTPTYLIRRGDWRIVGFWTLIMPWLVVILTWLWPNGANRTVTKSSADIVAAAFDSNPTLGERPKGLYLNGEERMEMAAEARDPRKRDIVWKDTLKYTRLDEKEIILANWA